MAEVFAGFLCSYALALLAAPLVTLALARARVNSPAVRRFIAEGTPLVPVSIFLHTFFFLTFTAAGTLLGLLLHGLEASQPAGGLGSPNRVFTLFILATAVIAIVPLAIAVPKWRLGLLGGGLIFAGVFGWLMPYMATWAPQSG